MSNIGMMDGAFFVGRKEIVDWINDTLDLSLQKVEQTASGAIACQLLDIMHPGQVSMAKVNWAANKDFEYVANYKVLQTAFTKLHIDRHIDVDRLIKGKYQDNLEFMQWFKRFFEMGVQDRGDYDCAAQRLKGKGGAEYNSQYGRSGGSASRPPAAPRAAPAASNAAAGGSGAATSAAKKISASSGSSTKAAGAAAATASKSHVIRPASSSAAVSTAAPAASSAASGPVTAGGRKELEALQTELAESRAQVSELSNTVQELRMELDGADKEKDFYFSKLRDIEMMLQDLEDKGEGTELTAAIFKILYATADGFDQAAAEEEGVVVPEEAEDETF